MLIGENNMVRKLYITVLIRSSVPEFSFSSYRDHLIPKASMSLWS